MNYEKLKQIIEAVLLASGQPMTVDKIQNLFDEDEQPQKDDVLRALADIQVVYADRSIELKEVASGYRFQVVQGLSKWVSRLWDEKPARYSRALMETMALIAYRQPITRSEIEEIRGVSVSSYIIKTLHEREWVRVVGHRDVPGRPALFATTKGFLDYFDLKSLDELPPLSELKDIDQFAAEFEGEAAAMAAAVLPEAANEDSMDDAFMGIEAVNDQDTFDDIHDIDSDLVREEAEDAVQSVEALEDKVAAALAEIEKAVADLEDDSNTEDDAFLTASQDLESEDSDTEIENTEVEPT